MAFLFFVFIFLFVFLFCFFKFQKQFYSVYQTPNNWVTFHYDIFVVLCIRESVIHGVTIVSLFFFNSSALTLGNASHPVMLDRDYDKHSRTLESAWHVALQKIKKEKKSYEAQLYPRFFWKLFYFVDSDGVKSLPELLFSLGLLSHPGLPRTQISSRVIYSSYFFSFSMREKKSVIHTY